MLTENSQGVALAYDVMGEGEPLVLLPGSGQSAATHRATGLPDMFAEHFQVILMDFSGLGASGRITSMAPSQWRDDVISVLDALQIERAHIAGTSMGGRVGARVAADFPDRVLTLLVDMPITVVDPDAEQQISAFFKDYENGRGRPGFERSHGEHWREAMAFFSVAREERPFQEYLSPRSYLANIAAPTLISRGDQHSDVHPITQATEWHSAAQSSALWIEPGASNPALMTACPQEVVNKFVVFVAAHSADAATST